MSAAALNIPALPVGSNEIGLSDLRAFVGLKPSPPSEQELPPKLNSIFAEISDLTNKNLLRVIGAHSAKEFDERRYQVFADYVSTLSALASLARVEVSPDLMETVVDVSFDRLNAKIDSEVPDRFGVAARDQARFTTWTLRRTLAVLKRTAESKPSETSQEERQLSEEFSRWLWWTLFHLDCLQVAIKFEKPMRSEIVEVVIEGLRAAVNAYTFARRGLALRDEASLEMTSPVSDWDEEDQLLLDDSMADLDREAFA